ncbi:class I SAM-dependent methyltransferase [Actinokineospora sp. PR83]|uniref:class I SAM-dependent methyltransferase n=1 Tax=Actinokineospora sp. PR83 TaxID=2884908 RepID=UPI0027DF12A6|nr:class I SAM-dependent methyltransferase [Actinokineospora sp. PR83]MCG8917591.1 class I SAM-dependent methyltransferase [Actinokineospora sp. PR83]
MSGLRGAYVGGVRAARGLADRVGLLDRLGGSGAHTARHLRTLFAIHDVADLAGLDLAWWSYPAMARVERFLAARDAPRVFEFGAGASTAWLARRAAEVHSVEHDAGFAGHVRALLADAPHVTLHAVPATPAGASTVVRSGRAGHEHLDFGAYASTIDAVGGEFDLVVVDGRARVACFRRALDHLAPDGLVVFDNIRRKRYAEATTTPGTRVEYLRGGTPALPYPTTTGLINRG